MILFGRMLALEAELSRLHGVSVQRAVEEGALALLALDSRDEHCLVEVERVTAEMTHRGVRAIVIRTPAGSIERRASLAMRWNACVIEPGASIVATIRAICDPLTICGLTCFDITDLLSLTTAPCFGGRYVPRGRRGLLTIHAPPDLSLFDVSAICDAAQSAHPDVTLLVATPTSNALTISLIVFADA